VGKLLGVWNYLQARLAEPSTHASVASLLTLAGLNLDVGVVHDSITAAGIAFGALGFFVRESKPLSGE
jgi:hypothetical protein